MIYQAASKDLAAPEALELMLQRLRPEAWKGTVMGNFLADLVTICGVASLFILGILIVDRGSLMLWWLGKALAAAGHRFVAHRARAPKKLETHRPRSAGRVH